MQEWEDRRQSNKSYAGDEAGKSIFILLMINF